jgi:hypothetical protein
VRFARRAARGALILNVHCDAAKPHRYNVHCDSLRSLVKTFDLPSDCGCGAGTKNPARLAPGGVSFS